MKRNIIKVLFTILIALLITNILAIYNYKSYSASSTGMTDVSEEVDFWKTDTAKAEEGALGEKVEVILSVLRTVGVIISVVTLSIIGIKFMLGSVEEKAKYKQTLIPWLVGAILIFAITALPSIIYDMSKGVLEPQVTQGPKNELPM